LKLVTDTVKEIIVLQIAKVDIERITKNCAINDTPLYWCNGVLFNKVAMEISEPEKEIINGKMFPESIVFAECKTYIEESKWNGYSVSVIDCTGYSMYEEMIKLVIDTKKLD